MRRVHALLLACLLLGTSACGGERSEEAKVADAYNAVVEALEEKDYESVCGALTERTREDLRKAATLQGTEGCGPTLQKVVAEVGVEKRAAATVSSADVKIVDGTSATVNDVRMLKEAGEWRLEGDVDFVRPFLSGGAAPR